MIRRLLLGCGALGADVVRRLSRWPGELQVVDTDENRVTDLRESGIDATAADPAEPDNYPDDIDVVVVADTDPTRNRAAAETAQNRFPEAFLIVYTGTAPGQGTSVAAPRRDRQRLKAVADKTIDPTAALADRVSTAADAEATSLHRLFRVLREITGPLAVLTHDSPDPDAIASAVGLSRIARRVGVEAKPCYFGDISHQENRALVNLLGLELENLESPAAIEEFESIALVDHSRPGVNNLLPAETEVDIVVDHHPPTGPVTGRFVDLRVEVGATSTLITEYFDRLGIAPESDVAGALLYGIRIDTKDFIREVGGADFEAAATLITQADSETLQKVETPSVSADVLELIAAAIRNRTSRGATLTSCVGRISNRDALAQASEQLLAMAGITTTLVYGFADGTVYLSGRARGADIDLGEVFRDAFNQIGSAGGHADMAGAQLPLGILADTDDTDAEALSKIISDVIDEQFFEALEKASLPSGGTDLTYERDPRNLDTEHRAVVRLDQESPYIETDNTTDDDSE
jgi:nanoRNase/pAp phosphatase (c-di-AMP/oligoRNAs hydrolase)